MSMRALLKVSTGVIYPMSQYLEAKPGFEPIVVKDDGSVVRLTQRAPAAPAPQQADADTTQAGTETEETPPAPPAATPPTPPVTPPAATPPTPPVTPPTPNAGSKAPVMAPTPPAGKPQ